MAYLIRPDIDECQRLGIPKLGHIPGIWSAHWTPETEAMDYLIAKGTGRWVSASFRSPYAAVRPLARASALSIGHDLTNFLDWCESRQVDWRNLSYGDIVEHYQGDMMAGRWSHRTSRKLAASTINRRMSTVVDFLSFVCAQGGRANFVVDFIEPVSARTGGILRSRRDGRPPRQRVGTVRQHPTQLRLPTLEETGAWLSGLKDAHGITPHLMAKTVVGLGLRAEEVLLLRLSQVPKMPTGPAKTVRMEICYGAKGGRDPNDPEKRGKARHVRVPVELLQDLRNYITGHRKLCLRAFGIANPGEPPPLELFLSKNTGRPLSYSRFYEIWQSPPQPFKHFSPHIGRHMWACYTLVEKIREEVELSVGVTGPLASIAGNIHQNLIETWISTQLGHVDQATSEMYLNWVVDQLDLQPHHESWWDFLNG